MCVAVYKAGLTNHTPEIHAVVKVHVSVLQFINRVFITTEDIATRDHVQHNILACITPTTCGKWEVHTAYGWMDGWMDG